MIAPRMIAATVSPSIQAFAQTNRFGRQAFRQDSVFRRRVRRRANADECVSQQRMQAQQHGQATEDFDRIADEHDAAFGERVGEGTREWRQNDERNDEALLQYRRLPGRRIEVPQQRDSCEQQRVVSQGRKRTAQPEWSKSRPARPRLH